jgi:NADPH:quinone reductase-like Zn-dependent oxidoreductase
MTNFISDNIGWVVAGAGLLGTLCVLHLLSDKGPRKLPLGPLTHVIITGGSSGIGLASAVKFRRRGCNVTIMARSVSKLEEAREVIEKRVSECGSNGKGGNVEGELCVMSVDVANKEKLDEAVRESCAKFNNRVGE